MRVLIGYNGSEGSRAAIEELSHIGLPVDSHVRIVAVAEPWIEPKTKEDALALVTSGVADANSLMPGLSCTGTVAEGPPSREILTAAAAFSPDLIILGAHSGDAGSSSHLGHTAQIVMNEASCSVRIARRKVSTSSRPPKLMVGYDGSHGSAQSVESIVKRTWPEGTEVRLLAVADAAVINSIGRFSPQMTNVAVESRLALQWAETLAATCIARLRKVDLKARVEIRIGLPKTMIVEEGERWDADCIFVAPHCGFDSYERYLLESISASVAERAQCSVEIVR
jgi:nucleotide-binding universal stress UspA family protein